MSIATTLFKAIDVLFDHLQNGRRRHVYKDVDFVTEKDVRYHNDDSCCLDTYFVKKDSGKYPILFYIHGGGFVAGDKHHRRAISQWFAMMGYFVVNVNYGLCPSCKFPTPLQHLFYALNWVEENADEYNLDLDKLVIGGDSAGAYYSTAVLAVANNKHLQERIGVTSDLVFKGALLNCGIYDISTALGGKLPFNMGEVILQDFADIGLKDLETYPHFDLCKTIDFVDGRFPKTFVTYAEKDIFCKGQSEILVEKLKENGVQVEEYHSTKFTSNHCFSLSWKGKDATTNNNMVEEFLKKIANDN